MPRRRAIREALATDLRALGGGERCSDVEDVTSQRDRAMGTDIARATFGIDRTGVMGR